MEEKFCFVFLVLSKIMNHFLFLFLFLGLSRSLFSLSVPSSSSPPFSFVNLTSHSSFRVPGDVGLFDRLRVFFFFSFFFFFFSSFLFLLYFF